MNKIYYFKHPMLGCIFIKPIEVIDGWDGRWLHYFTATYLERLEELEDVKECKDLMIKVYKRGHSHYINDIVASELSKPLSQTEMDELGPFESHIKCWQDEIDLDFDGDIEKWKKYRKVDTYYELPKMSKFHKRQLIERAFNETELLIPMDKVKKFYPELMTTITNGTLAKGIRKGSKEMRNIIIGEILNEY